MKPISLETIAKFICMLLLGVGVPGWAEAPAGRYTLSTDTVLDTQTNLTWQRNPPLITYSWANAISYCQALNLNGTGWRLPAIKELQSLVDPRRWRPAIDLTAFPNTPSAHVWSSLPINNSATGGPEIIWSVDFNHGNTMYAMALTDSYHLRCVK